MKIFSYLEDAAECLSGCVVALGNFDGIHKGHQELINTAVRIAKENGLPSAVFTFSNHPMNILAGKNVVKNIMSIEEKAEVIDALGVDYMINVRFNDFVRKSSPELFVERILVRDFKAKHVVCGFNYSFGFKAEGTPELLKKLGEKYGFGVTVIPELSIGNETVSSTRIRKLISEGKMIDYFDCVGRNYRIEGTVVEGQKLGRTIGFPTVNLNLQERYALPLNGVYITKTYVDYEVFNSVTNVGNKPTAGLFEKNAETHLFGFDGDLYGRNLVIEFMDFLRPERKFDSFELLSEQIKKDCEAARDYFDKNIPTNTANP